MCDMLQKLFYIFTHYYVFYVQIFECMKKIEDINCIVGAKD